MSLSMIYSDRMLKAESLAAVARHVNTLFIGGHHFMLDDDVIDRIRRDMLEPSWRDSLTILKTAKDGWLEKCVDGHFLGPDGYEHHILSFKPNDAIRKLRANGDNDLFFICFFENGVQQDHEVTKPAWYAMYDKTILNARGEVNPMVDRATEYGNELADFVIGHEATKG